MKGYKVHTEYRFEALGELIAITDIAFDGSCVTVEEVRKNGQEDTHCTGVIAREADVGWTWDEGRDMFARYHSEKLANAILAHIRIYGIPG